MAGKTNHWKLGLFVLCSLIVGVGVLIGLGASRFDEEETLYVTYFDESVQGLDEESPVKFRGVTIGSVSQISIAPDGRHVQVQSALDVRVLENLGLDPDALGAPADLRFQLASAGLTGLKFLQVDFFAPGSQPPPVLPFNTPDNYIPAASSMLKSIEDSVIQTVGRFPETADQVLAMLRNINEILEDIHDKKIPERVLATLDKFDRTLDSANGVMNEAQDTIAMARHEIQQLEAAELSKEARAAVSELHQSLAHANEVLARVKREGGIIDNVETTTRILESEAENLDGTMASVNATMGSVRGTADAFRDVAYDATRISGDIDATLVVIREASNSIRRVADALERDSDMLIKGRSRGEP